MLQALEDSLAEEYEGVAIVDEEDNVLGTMPFVGREEAAAMGPGEVHDYMTRLADAAGMKEEFQQMVDDAIVRCLLLACMHVCACGWARCGLAWGGRWGQVVVGM